MSKHWIGADLRIMLGYRTGGARHFFTNAALRGGMSAEDAGLKLHVTAKTVIRNCRRLLPEKTRKVNESVQSLLRRPKT